jgi:hypothetical protein
MFRVSGAVDHMEKQHLHEKKSLLGGQGVILTSKEVVDAVIARMSWPDHLNQKFRSIPCPPDSARLQNYDLQDALDWLDSDLGDDVQTMAAAKYMVEELLMEALALVSDPPSVAEGAQQPVAAMHEQGYAPPVPSIPAHAAHAAAAGEDAPAP